MPPCDLHHWKERALDYKWAVSGKLFTNFALRPCGLKIGHFRCYAKNKYCEDHTSVHQMQDSDPEGDRDDVIFLSPDESPPKSKDNDPGASPVLRRSNRKRKSVSAANCPPPGGEMSKGSSAKKKKASPSKAEEPGKAMPKIPRTPVAQDAKAADPPTNAGEKGKETPDKGGEFERLLAAMEARLSSKIDAASKAVSQAVLMSKLTNDALGSLEEKVDSNEEALRREIRESETRVRTEMRENIKDLVDNQLKAAGFDPDLSAGALSSLAPSRLVQSVSKGANGSSYAEMAGKDSVPSGSIVVLKKDGREERFWESRRSLRFWPVKTNKREDLEDFLVEKLRLDRSAVQEDLG